MVARSSASNGQRQPDHERSRRNTSSPCFRPQRASNACSKAMRASTDSGRYLSRLFVTPSRLRPAFSQLSKAASPHLEEVTMAQRVEDEAWVQLATRIPKPLHRELKLHCVRSQTARGVTAPRHHHPGQPPVSIG